MALPHERDALVPGDAGVTAREVLAALMSGEEVEEVASLFPPRPAWMADALCREYPDVNFYPALGESSRKAIAICRRCHVREECLAFALERDERGVWGGTTTPERRRLRRQHNR